MPGVILVMSVSAALGIIIVSLFPTSWDPGSRQYLFRDNSALNKFIQKQARQGLETWQTIVRFPSVHRGKGNWD